MSEDSASGKPRGTTPDEWESPPDARSRAGAGTYPNYWVRKTRSGHTFGMDDSENNETVWLEHRSGSMIQLMPDGAVQYVSHKGRYDVTYGENRIKITGAQDTSIDGDSSIKTKGNHNSTVYGDSVSSIKGKSVTTAKSINTVASEQMDTVAGSKTEKIENSSTTQVLGASTTLSKGGMTVGSTGSSVAVGANKQLGLKSGQGMAMESGQKMSVKSADTMALESTGKMSMKADGAQIAISGGKIYLNSGQADSADTVADVVQFEPTPEPTQEQTYTNQAVA
jgi:hypothetical protein